MNYWTWGRGGEQLQQPSEVFSRRIVGTWEVKTLKVEVSAEPL